MKVQIELLEATRRGGQVALKVALSFHNEAGRRFELDKVSACASGRPENWVFKISHDGHEVPYQGEMKKRAHPGKHGFFHVGAGETLRLEVTLGEQYAFPAARGDFTVKFDSANHFSKDDVWLESPEVRFSV